LKRKKDKKLRSGWLRVVIGIYRFFVPKDFKAELIKGQIRGEQIRSGQLTPKMLPTWWLGKGIRKLVDPKHKMKIGKEK